MSEIINKETSGLAVQFVEREYFIDRVLILQEKYKEHWSGWYEFLQAYRQHDQSIDSNNFELDEWAFLCEAFSSDLFLREFYQDSGPPHCRVQGSQNPERRSGFCFGALTCSTPSNISTLRSGQLNPVTDIRR